MGALHQSFSEKMIKVNKVFRDNNFIPLHVMLHDTYGRLHKHELKLGYCYAFSSTSEIIKSSPFCGHLKKLYLRTGQPIYNKVIYPHVIRINIQSANEYTEDNHNKWSCNPCIRFREDHGKKLHLNLNRINCRIIYDYSKEFTEPQIK